MKPHFGDLFFTSIRTDIDANFFFFLVSQTTLLNYILTANHGKRIAVIENEVLAVTCIIIF